MSTLKSVGNKLFKTELALHNVELALTDDLSKLISLNPNYVDRAIRINDNVESLFKVLNGIMDEIDNMKTQLSNIDGAKANLGGNSQDINNVINKIQGQVKELGLDIKDIKGYSKALEIIKENNALMNSLEQSRKVANNVLSQLK
jgi:RNA polymerase-interacting CarD/CdnL/TRCF family regulator